jgi:very-short-patch-repair endonuclease
VIGEYIVDFSCFEKRLVIEIDGGHHLDQEELDLIRTEFLVGQGYRVIRFWNREVIDEIDTVLDVILDTLEGLSSK